MKLWVHTEEKEDELQQGAALQREHLHLRLGSAAPLGLNKCVPMINPGLAPWAMNKYRPKGLIARMGVSLYECVRR